MRAIAATGCALDAGVRVGPMITPESRLRIEGMVEGVGRGRSGRGGWSGRGQFRAVWVCVFTPSGASARESFYGDLHGQGRNAFEFFT